MAWLTLIQAAERLQTSEGTVRSLIKSGRLQATLIGSTYRIQEEALDNIKPAPARKKTKSNQGGNPAWKKQEAPAKAEPPKKPADKPPVNSKKETAGAV